MSDKPKELTRSCGFYRRSLQRGNVSASLTVVPVTVGTIGLIQLLAWRDTLAFVGVLQRFGGGRRIMEISILGRETILQQKNKCTKK